MHVAVVACRPTHAVCIVIAPSVPLGMLYQVLCTTLPRNIWYVCTSVLKPKLHYGGIILKILRLLLLLALHAFPQQYVATRELACLWHPGHSRCLQTGGAAAVLLRLISLKVAGYRAGRSCGSSNELVDLIVGLDR